MDASRDKRARAQGRQRARRGRARRSMRHSARKHAITPMRARRASRPGRSRAVESAADRGGCTSQELTCDEGAVNQGGRFRAVRFNFCNRGF